MTEFENYYNDFQEFEIKSNVFGLNYKGTFLWERLRKTIFYTILTKLGVFQEAHPSKEFSKFSIIRSFFDLKKNPFLSKKSDIVFFGHARRKFLNNKLWWDIYVDPLLENTNLDYTYLELPYLSTHYAPAKTKNIKYMDIVQILGKLRMRFHKLKLEETVVNEIMDIQNQLNSHFNVSIDIYQLFVQSIIERECFLPLYLRIFKRIKPKVVFIVVNGGKNELIEACKMLKIPVVELQHGITGKNLAYDYREGTKRYLFPDYILLFGNYWKSTSNFPIPSDRLVSIGYEFLNNHYKQYKGSKVKNQMLIISQGTVGSALVDFAFEIIDNPSVDIDVLFKLHPGEYGRWKTLYPNLSTSSIQVIDNDNIPLYELLANSKYIVGIASMVMFEASVFKNRLILLDNPGIEHMNYLIENQVCKVVKSSNDFIELMEDTWIIKDEIIENLFERNTIERFQEFYLKFVES